MIGVVSRFLGLVMAGAAGLVHAQVPGAALPGQVERQFQEAPKARSQALPPSAPLKPQPVPEGAEQQRFLLKQIELEGVTVYPAGAFAEDHAPLLGKEISLADLYRLADRMTARYRNDGYLLSQFIVPEQKVTDGIARLRAVEGFVGAVRLQGVENDQRGLVAALAEDIRASRPLRAEVLERQMLLINDLPGVFARAILAPSPDTFGAADLTIQFSQRQVAGGLSANNRGGKSMGPMRYLADVEGINLLGLHDRTQLRHVYSPSRELSYFSLLHEQPVGRSGGRLSLSLTDVRAIPEEMAFIPLNIETRSRGFTLGYAQPLLRARSENLQWRASLSTHDGETTLLGFTDSHDKLSVLRLGLGYDAADQWDGINLFDVELSQGLRAFGASGNGDLALSRPEGKVDFTKLNVYAARVQNLSQNWSLLAAFTSQYAFSNLLVSELFSYGGEAFGRAYDPSELVGDHGAALKLELRYGNSFNLGMPVSYTLYGYYDVGQVRQRPVAGVTASPESAAAAGIGVRFGLGQHVSGFIEQAKPLNRDVAAEGNRDSRLYLGLSARF
jgi:hemolysin activation/secretion protein